MAANQRKVATIPLYTDRPTSLNFQDLYNWVVWQFPRRMSDGYCGAVRPPIPHHDWYPALIQQQEKRVQVYAHLKRSFDSPEAAAEHIHQNG